MTLEFAFRLCFLLSNLFRWRGDLLFRSEELLLLSKVYKENIPPPHVHAQFQPEIGSTKMGVENR